MKNSSPRRRGDAEIWKRVKRGWCRVFHDDVMFAGGRTYQCRRCLERFENAAQNGPMPSTVIRRLNGKMAKVGFGHANEWERRKAATQHLASAPAGRLAR